jgi:hypothetical protein
VGRGRTARTVVRTAAFRTRFGARHTGAAFGVETLRTMSPLEVLNVRASSRLGLLA